MKDLSVILPYFLLVATCLLAWACLSTSATLRAELTHVDSGRGFTKRELLSRMAARSTARAAILGASAQAETAPVSCDIGEYLVHFGIGTPRPQAVAMVLDTGSDLIWTQCACIACFKQAFPVFDPAASGSSRTVSCTSPICSVLWGLLCSACGVKENPCHYDFFYADKLFSRGTIIEDTFTFNGSTAPELRFGCGMDNIDLFTSERSGTAGFGRGRMSLPSQLGVSAFSYCFRTIQEPGSSPLFLGTPDNLGAKVQSTPFAPTPTGSSFYYLSLQGVTVGKTLLPFNASVFALQHHGTIIDSGTSITRFPQAVFQSLREAFVLQVPLPVANFSARPDMLCFSTAQAADPKKVPVPKLILHLEGADWDFPRESYVLDVEQDSGTGGDLLCVVILSAGNLNMTIIGNFQQQNTHIVYDLEANKMVFAPASCDQL